MAIRSDMRGMPGKSGAPGFERSDASLTMPRDEKSETEDKRCSGTILVADDHELIRKSISEVLLHEFAGSAVTTTGHFDQALALVADPKVFLAIVDLTMPGMNSPRDLVKLRTLRPELCVVVLSGSESRSDILAALEAGAHGYIPKCEPTELVIKRIRHVLGGEIYVPPAVADLTAVSADAPDPGASSQAPLDGVLTPRQREVLLLITEGLSNKEIGRRLDVAEGTVKMHVATILKTIGANNRAHAAAIGRKYVVVSA